MLVWSLLPLYNMLEVALTAPSRTFAGHLFPSHPTWQNFRTLFTGGLGSPLPDFWVQLANSIIAAVVTTALVLLLATITTYAITRVKPGWGAWVGTSALLVYVIPASFLVLPLYVVMDKLGLLGNLLSFIIGITTLATPYAIWVLRQFGEDIPTELDEAARVDGAGVVRIFRHIYLPMIRPALVPVGIYAFLLSWNNFLYAFLFLTDPTTLTIPVAMGSIIHDQSPWSVLMATGLVYAVPPLILYTIFHRELVGGLASGSSKG